MLGESVKAQSRRGSLLSFAIKKGSGICRSLFCVVRRFRRANRDYDRLKYAAMHDEGFQPFERLTATPRSRYDCSIQISQTICPALLLSSLRDCCVPACRPSRRRSPLARLAPRKSVSLKRATRSDLDAPISSLPFSVSRPCPLAVGEGGTKLPKQENNHESRASQTDR